MAKKKPFWECETCGSIFDEESEAIKCEKFHFSIDSMEVVDLAFEDGDGRLPAKALIESGGAAAVYIRDREGSIEDFDVENGGWR